MVKKKIKKGDNCLNCQEPLKGENFCPNCGQINDQLKPTFFQLMGEFFANLIAFDSKFYRTMIPLIIKPGIVSFEFSKGRRSYYASPVRVFLLVTFLFLFLEALDKNDSTLPFEDNVSIIENDENAQESLDLTAIADSTETAEAQELEEAVESISKSFNIESDSTSPQFGFLRMFGLINNQDTLSVDEGLAHLEIPNTLFNRLIYTNIKKSQESDFEEFVRYYKSKWLIILLLFLPFLAIMLKLIYYKKSDLYYIDHFTFAIHQLTVFLFVHVLLNIIEFVPSIDFLGGFLRFGFLVHLFFALLKMYGEKNSVTFFKLILLIFGFMFLALIFLFLSGIITLMTY